MTDADMIHPTAELVVAAGIVQAGEAAGDLLEIVSPSDFSSETLQLVVEAMAHLHRGVEPIDNAAIIAEATSIAKERKAKRFGVTQEFLHKLLTEDARRAPAYAHTVKRFAWLRQAKAFADWYQTELAALPDPDELFKLANDRLSFLKPPTKGERFLYGWDTDHYDETLAKREAETLAGTVNKFDYPWASWNQRAKPLRAGMVGLLSGPEGSGKSGYLEMIAEHWAKQRHVVFVHMENNQEYTLDRRMARWSHIDIDRLEEGILTPVEKEKKAQAQRNIRQFSVQLHYLDGAGMTMGEIITELKARRDEGICDAVVLDYINMVVGSRGQLKQFGDKLDARQADDMAQFKAFCETPGHKIVGFTAAQYNKEGKKDMGRKRSWNMRGTGEFADKAQLIVLLDREVLDAPLKDPQGNIVADVGEDSPTIKVRIDKQNRGKKTDFEQVHVGRYFEVRDKPNNV